MSNALRDEGRVSVPGVRALERVDEASAADRGYPLRADVGIRPLGAVHL